MNSVHGRTVYTGDKVLKDAYVVFRGRSIVSVGARKRGKLVGDYPVVTPALIDAHSHIGMVRAGEPGSEAEANPKLDSIITLADALDSVQMDDNSLTESVEAGVLYSCVVPGSGNIIGGRSAVIRNWAADTTAALVSRAGLKGAFGHNPRSTTGWKGTRAHTRMGALAILRQKLTDVQRKIAKRRRLRGKKKLDVELTAAEEVLRSLLEGRETWRVHVHKADDVAALLRIVDEFKLKITCEHCCDIHDAGVFRELARRKIPVVYGPLDSFPYKVELKHESWRNVKLLVESGAAYGLMTDHPVILQRTLLMTLRWFLRAGLKKADALGIVTRSNARILGLKSLGTLAKGKWASFVGWNGDLFGLGSWPVSAWGEGREVYAE